MKPPSLLPLLLICTTTTAQTTVPEQDCINALPVCDIVVTQSTQYVGIGMIDDLQDGTSCLENEENNSIWYTFDIAQSGMLEFIIDSGSGDSLDYDFALYNITGATCADIYDGGLEVRCNYAFTSNLTGLMTGYTNISSSSNGPSF